MTIKLIKIILLFLSILIVGSSYSQTTFTISYSSAGSGVFVVPCGVTSITVDCWGGGGAGGGAYASKNGAGGGGAGGYGQSVYAVTAGSSISYTVGAGGAAGTINTATGSVGGSGSATTFSTTVANGGTGANGSGAGGSGGNSTGGNGGTAVGSTAITGGNGNAGVAGSSAIGGKGGNAGGTGGGAGGAASADAAGSNGNDPGGGGSGGSNGSGPLGLGGINFGGSGGSGRVTVRYIVPFTVNAGADITLATCTTTNVTLAASTLSAGTTGLWTTSASSVSITNPTTVGAAASGSGFTAGSTQPFIWTVTNGTCSYQDEMTVSVPSCAQSNSTCASAFNLSIDGALKCGENTNNIGVLADGCVISGSGQTVWYSFTVPAATTYLVLNVLGTATPYPNYGLYSGSCAGLTCAQNVTYSLSAGDPGKHTLLTGLTPGATYYVQVQSSTTANSQFCISINTVANNSTAPANALSINNCGVTFNGTTNGGYYPSGTSAGFNNLDGAATTAAGASAGDDVTFIINNISWFKFCSVNTGTYNVQFDVVSCVFSGASSGSQMAILTGTNTSLTNIWQATNPTQPSTAVQTSPNFSLAAGGCAYLVVDGFAGDACSYSYVLTNVAGGCILLPIELLSFNAIQKEDIVYLTWATATEINNDYFAVERSGDGINFKEIEKIDGAGISSNVLFYSTTDKFPLTGISYYRLKQTDYNGNFTYSNIVSVDFDSNSDLKFDIVPNPNMENIMSSIVLSTIPDKEITIIITDLQGVNLFETKKKVDSNKIEIPNSFSKGIYFVKVISSDFTETKRMIIK
jgi:hypothetical protein